MSDKSQIAFLIPFLLLVLFFSDSILFNEEALICFSLLLIFFAIYKVLRKSSAFFFALETESLYLTLTYFLKLNISLVSKILELFSSLLGSLESLNEYKALDLNYVYLKLLDKKSLNLGLCASLLDSTLPLRKGLWLLESLALVIKKSVVPSKNYSALKLNGAFFKIKGESCSYGNFFFIAQFFHIFHFIQLTNTLNKFAKSYISYVS
jgi:hypothetical protein